MAPGAARTCCARRWLRSAHAVRERTWHRERLRDPSGSRRSRQPACHARGTAVRPPPRAGRGRGFEKGHGTETAFLILPDPGDLASLPATLVARLCDRHAGLGADGVLRVVRTAALAAGPNGASADAAAALAATGAPDSAEWFMDYRNADGSVAEMCGNGLRVFARYLLDHGMAEGAAFTVATRAGLRPGTERKRQRPD